MSNKNQGEGDYEAARRFNKAEQDFVKRKLGKKQSSKPDPSLLSDEEMADDEMDDRDDVSDGETTKRVWRPGIEFPDRK